MAELTVVVLIVIAAGTSAKNPPGNFEEQDLLFTGLEGYLACVSRGHTERSQVEREHRPGA